MKEKHFKLLRWLPVAGSMALVILIAIISAMTIKELREDIYWRKRTFGVVLEAQAYEDSLVHSQGHVRHYAVEGTPNLLIEYQNDTNAELREFNKLADLTRDNPEQQQRLNELHAAMKAVFDYDDRVIGVYARQGSEAAVKMESEGGDLLDAAIRDLEKFKGEEKKLLDKQDAREQADYRKAAYLLIGGSVLAAGLLVLSNYFAGREMARRRRAEAEQRELIVKLQKALAEVKTLSGLIPICGWCKKVRSDEGFWQSVEQYVAARTDATFTHGMCLSCSEKWEKDVAKAAADKRSKEEVGLA